MTIAPVVTNGYKAGIYFTSCGPYNNTNNPPDIVFDDNDDGVMESACLIEQRSTNSAGVLKLTWGNTNTVPTWCADPFDGGHEHYTWRGYFTTSDPFVLLDFGVTNGFKYR